MRTTDIRYIVLHCSATRSTQDYSPEALERDHRARGFRGIGYHYYVCRSCEDIPCRPLDQIGAHVWDNNHGSWGVFYERGVDSTRQPTYTRTPKQRASLLRLLAQLKGYAPQAHILGHRDLSPDRNGDGRITPDEWLKSCPCLEAETEYAPLNKV